MDRIEMLREDQRTKFREDRMAEVGTEAPCPVCGTARVLRSDYIRCNPCALNWLEGEPRDQNPRVWRFEKLRKELQKASPKEAK